MLKVFDCMKVVYKVKMPAEIFSLDIELHQLGPNLHGTGLRDILVTRAAV